ncbi:MAG TPA: hypothetical protein VK437_03990 [Steroidobacteraceae bacterium]|nr:hypothetical protein [Steroidobacteraceae bacterium]
MFVKSLLVGASLVAAGTFASTVIAQQNVPSSGAPSGAAGTSAEDLQEEEVLRQQLETLQRRLSDLEERRRAQEAAAAQAAAAAAQAASASAAAQTQPQAQAPRTDKIYYKGVSITLGGFVAGESVYRTRGTGNDVATAYDGDYFHNNPEANSSQLVFTARQSQLSALIEGAPNPLTHLMAYGEFDFQGAAQTANSKESNSYNPSLRQLYGSAGWDDMHLHVLAGQAWSLATMNVSGIDPRAVAIPPTIDAQYLPGFTWTRQAQLRITEDVSQQVSLALSLENPQTTFYTGPNALPAGINLNYEAPGTGLGFNSENTLSLNHIPDGILKAAGDPSIGDYQMHLEGFGLYRSFYERLNHAGESEPGGGFGAGVLLPLVPRLLELEVSGLSGRGIGRYGSAQLPDVTFDAQGDLRPIKELIGLAGLTLHAAPSWDFYLMAGEEKDDSKAYNLVAGKGKKAKITPYGYGNEHYSNAGCYSETSMAACIGNLRAVEQGTLGFWQSPYAGSYGTIRWGLQYSRSEFKAFPGVGGGPLAIENMVFASIRYYPFDHIGVP